MDRRSLYELCMDCKNADRSRGGNVQGCMLEGPRVTESECKDYIFWLTKPPQRNLWKGLGTGFGIGFGILGLIGVVLLGLLGGFLKFLKWIAPSINKGTRDFYIPKIGRRL